MVPLSLLFFSWNDECTDYARSKVLTRLPAFTKSRFKESSWAFQFWLKADLFGLTYRGLYPLETPNKLGTISNDNIYTTCYGNIVMWLKLYTSLMV